MEVRPATFIRLDLFPAQVFETSNPHDIGLLGEELRAIVTNDYFYLFAEGTTGPKVIYENYLSEFDGNNKTGYILTTPDEKVFEIVRAKNCGCGSTLRGFFPYPGVPFISQIAR